MKNDSIKHIHLIGDEKENFYSLGKRDKNDFDRIYQQIYFLCARTSILGHIMKTTTQIGTSLYGNSTNEISQQLEAYAEGLERPVSDLYFSMLLPELVSSFNKWAPNLLSIIPGCSSLFTWDEENKGVIHSRILDYATSGPFEKGERSVFYEFKNRHNIFGFTTAGMPLPSISSMNSAGLTCALHYKHSDFLNTKGESIFSIIYQMLSYCSNVQEARKYLKGHSSIAHWGLNLSDRSGQVMTADIRGNEIYQETYEAKDHPYLYFNNRPLLMKDIESKLQPYGNRNQCVMRKETLKDSMKSYNGQAKNLQLESLKALSTINKKQKNINKWKQSPLTIASIQSLSFHNTLNSSLYVLGKAPKQIEKGYCEYETIDKSPTLKATKPASKKQSSYDKGLEYLGEFQSLIDTNQQEEGFHKLQMAIQYLKDHPESDIAQFYFYVWQYILLNDKKDLSYLYQEFLTLEGKLPQYLEDHRLLFIMRIDKQLKHSVDIELKDKIVNINLKRVYDKEIKLKAFAIKGLKHLIIPRLEILDVLYIY